MNNIRKIFNFFTADSTVPAVVVDIDGFLRIFNEQFLSLVKKEGNDLEGTHYLTFFSKDKHDYLEKKKNELSPDKESVISDTFLRGDGREINVEIRTVVCDIPDDGSRCYICRIHNLEEKDASEKTSGFVLAEDDRTSSAILNATKDSVYIVDIDGKVLKTNRIGLQRLKWINKKCRNSANCITGMMLTECFQEEDSLIIKKYLKKVILSNEPERVQREWGGSYFDLSIYPVCDEREDLLSAVIFVSNITKEKKVISQLKDSDHRYRTLVESMNDGLMIVDRNARLIYLNPRVCEISGYCLDEVMGRSIFTLITEECRNDALEFFKKASLEKHQRFETKCIASNGKIFDVLVSLGSIPDSNGVLSGIVGVLTDISGIKAAAARLKYIADFEGLIARISAGFINAGAAHKDYTITGSLEAIARFENLDRAFIYQPAGNKIIRTYLWDIETAEFTQPGFDQSEINVSDFKWSYEKILKHEVIQISSVDEIPDEAKFEKEIVITSGMLSWIILPMIYGEKVVGTIGFSSRNKKIWSEETVSLLRILSDIFINVIEKNKIEDELFTIMISRLSLREVELIRYLSEGKKWPADKRQIGKMMDVLPGTLDKFMARIKEKLNISETEKIVTTARFYLNHLKAPQSPDEGLSND